MKRPLKALLVLAAIGTQGCGAATSEPVTNTSETAMKEPSAAPKPASKGPVVRGRTFETLDEYLAFLEKVEAPVGKAYYREVSPGIYELVTTVMPPPPPQRFTREQLEREFGFRE